MNGTVNLNDMQQLFLSRASAFKNIAHNDPSIREKAHAFLLATMVQSATEYDFPLKEQFVIKVTYWDLPVIIASRSDGTVNAIVYKINYKIGEEERTLHEISFFSKNESGEYKYTHKYDLSALNIKHCSTAPAEQTQVRQLGDLILHRETETVLDFTKDSKRLLSQIDILKRILVATGGVGIASNQCAEIEDPLTVTLVGVDYNNPEHVIKAINRYPNTLFPQMITCINPSVVDLSPETESFAEGCLSFQGRIRGQVKRPKSLTVKYLNIDGSETVKDFSGSDARVMQHELDHILDGKVYIQKIIEELSFEQCQLLLELIDSLTPNASIMNPFLTPFVLFERDQNDNIVIQIENARDNLQSLNPNLLNELAQALRVKMQNYSSCSP